MFWNQAIWRTPARLTRAGTHRPTMAMPQFSMPAGVGPAEQGVDVEDPGRDDGRVAGPGLDPVAPAHQVAGEVAELVAGVGVEPAVAVGDPPGELAEQDGEQHGADGDDAEHDDAHGAGAGDHGRHGEHAGADDAADDQAGGRGQAERVGLLLVAGGERCPRCRGGPGRGRPAEVRSSRSWDLRSFRPPGQEVTRGTSVHLNGRGCSRPMSQPDGGARTSGTRPASTDRTT